MHAIRYVLHACVVARERDLVNHLVRALARSPMVLAGMHCFPMASVHAALLRTCMRVCTPVHGTVAGAHVSVALPVASQSTLPILASFR